MPAAMQYASSYPRLVRRVEVDRDDWGKWLTHPAYFHFRRGNKCNGLLSLKHDGA